MFKSTKGPIEEFSWGRFIINGEEHTKLSNKKIVGVGKDIRLIGDEVCEWKERRGHLLSNSMITGIFAENTDVLIIGNGVYDSLKCPETVKNFVLEKCIKKLIIEKTPDACKIYNDLYNKDENIALLVHGTC